MSLNVWHHLAATYDGVTLRLYVDGALSNSAAASLTLAHVGSQPCTIAASTSGTGPVSPASFFAGSVDEVAIYTTAPLTPRILAHFNAGQPGTGMGTTSNALTLAAGLASPLARQRGAASRPGRCGSGSPAAGRIGSIRATPTPTTTCASASRRRCWRWIM